MSTKNYPAGRALPAGGTQGQVLTKASGDDQDASWEAPAGGGGSISATDGTTTVANMTTLHLPAGLLADGGGGDARIVLQQPAGAQSNGAYLELDPDPGTGAGGSAGIGGGDGNVGQAGGDVFAYAGAGDVGGTQPSGAYYVAGGGHADGTGGDFRIVTGSGGSASAKQGGDFIVLPQPGDGAGRHGLVFLNLPISDPGVSGALWNNAGTVKVSP